MGLYFQQGYNFSNNLIILDKDCPIENGTYAIVSNTSANQQRRVEELLDQVSNSKDVEILLAHINWRISTASCEQSCYNFTYSTYQFYDVCSDSSCCLSDSIDDLLRFSTQCNNASCKSVINSYVITKWYIFLVLGLLSLVGNVIVIFDKIMSLRKKHNKNKEIQIYHTLVLNLAIADVLMGIYLTAIAFEIRRKVADSVFFSEYGFCNWLGIINTVSSQVSLTTLFIISFYRLVAVIKPFKRQHLKSVITTIISTWIFWLAVSVLPVIPLEPFEITFSIGMVKGYQYEKDSFITLPNFVAIMQSIVFPSFNGVTEVESILQTVTQYPTPSVMKRFSRALGWVNVETENWSIVGYYDYQYSCSPSYLLVNHETYRFLNYFGLTFVLYNLIVSIGILISYISLSLKVHNKERFCVSCCNGCVKSCKRLLSNKVVFLEANIAKSENQKMFKRISFVVATDILCWIPVCISSLIFWHIFIIKTIQNLGDFLEFTIPFQTVMLFLVSINSILNPFIYSYYLWKLLFKKLKTRFFTKPSHVVSHTHNQISMF